MVNFKGKNKFLNLEEYAKIRGQTWISRRVNAKKKEIFGNFFNHGKIDWKFKVVNYRKKPISST